MNLLAFCKSFLIFCYVILLASCGKSSISIDVQKSDNGFNGNNLIVNNDPVAEDDGSFVTSHNTMISISVLDNDDDSDGNSLIIDSYSQGSNGSVILNGNNLEYTPDASFYGRDTFTYTIDDGNGAQDTATVTVDTVDSFTWTGNGSDDLWSNSDNWCGAISGNQCSGGVIPGNSDTARFNSVCAINCNVSINTNLDLNGFLIQDSFTGTITQEYGYTINIGNGNFSQSGGNFFGGDSNITITGGFFNLHGGTFTSTSAILKQYIQTNIDSTLVTINSNATFNHNNGTLNVDFQRPWECGTTYGLLDLPATLTVYNIRFDGMSSGCGGGNTRTDISNGSRIIVQNNLILGGGHLTGNLDLYGDLLLPDDKTWSRDFGLSSAVINFVGTNDQQYNLAATDKSGAHIVINKTSGSVTPTNPSYTTIIRSLKILSGHFQAPTGILKFYKSGLGENYIVLQLSNGASFDHNNGTIIFDHLATNIGGTYYLDIDINDTFSVNNLAMDNKRHAARVVHVRVINDPLIVEGTFTYEEGPISGSMDLRGDLISNNLESSSSLRGTGTFLISGNQSQTITQNGYWPMGDFTVDKSGGSLLLASNVSLDGSGQELIMNNGSIDMSGYNLTINSALTMDTGTDITLNGGALTASGVGVSSGTHDNGTINP